MENKVRIIKERLPQLKSLSKSCVVCPRQCRVNRLKNERGHCRAGITPVVYSYSPHYGEEPPLSGTRGSGTIFFTHCNMGCVYCQNYNFSQLSDENQISIEQLAGIMIQLQTLGCHNINLVSPTHYVPQIVEAISKALELGLEVPIVYNTGGYDSLEVIQLLEGIIDIYMPDMRYRDNQMALKYSHTPNYAEHNRACVSEMQRQVGDLNLDEFDIATQGLIIRCLVLPYNISGSEETLEFIASKISQNAYVSLMSQYYPIYKAYSYQELSRRVTDYEYRKVVAKLNDLELNNGWVQANPNGMDTSLGGHRIKLRKQEGV